GQDLPLLEPRWTRLEEVAQVALGVELANEGALALLGPEQRQGGGHRGLPDPALPGDEEKLAVEEVDGHLAVSTSHNAHLSVALRVVVELDLDLFWCLGDADPYVHFAALLLVDLYWLDLRWVDRLGGHASGGLLASRLHLGLRVGVLVGLLHAVPVAPLGRAP